MATTMTSLNTKLSAEEKDAFVRNTAALGLTDAVRCHQGLRPHVQRVRRLPV